MVWGVITDASYANAQGSSQGAFGVVCAEEKVLEEGCGNESLALEIREDASHSQLHVGG